jgi:hypothetical protein
LSRESNGYGTENISLQFFELGKCAQPQIIEVVSRRSIKRRYGATEGPCKGYEIDHVKPLACGGADAPINM